MGKPGRKSRKPLCIVYKQGETVTAALVSPIDDRVRSETGTGPFAAMGVLRDLGYNFGEMFVDDIPEWVSTRIPKKVKIIGAAHITGFPLV